MSCSRTQRSVTGEARNPLSRDKHSTTEPLRSQDHDLRKLLDDQDIYMSTLISIEDISSSDGHSLIFSF